MSNKTLLTYFKELPLWAKTSTIISISISGYVLSINAQNTTIETPYIFILFSMFSIMYISKNINQKRINIVKKQNEKKAYGKVQEDANLWLRNLKKDLRKEIKNIKTMYAKKGKEPQNQLTLDQEVITLDEAFTLVVNPKNQQEVFLLDNTNEAAQNPIQANRLTTLQQKLKERGINSKVVASKQNPPISAPIIEAIESAPNNSVKFPPHLINLN